MLSIDICKFIFSPCFRNTNIFEEKRTDDATQLVQTIRVTQLAGIVSLLYSILLHSGAPSRGDNIPPALPDHTVRVVERAFRMLNHLALLDLKLLQVRPDPRNTHGTLPGPGVT